MTKRLSITINNYVYNSIFKDIEISNKSARIEELLLKGIESELGHSEGIKSKLIEQNKIINEQKEQIRILNVKLEKSRTRRKGKIISITGVGQHGEY